MHNKLMAYVCLFVSFQESGDDEYHGEHSDTEDEVDSDFDIDEGDEPDSDQEEDAPRRKGRVVTKAYKVETIRSDQTLNQVNLKVQCVKRGESRHI